MGWLIALAVIVLIAVLPIGISARYGETGPLVWLWIGPLRLRAYPSRKRNRETPEKHRKNSGETPSKQKENSGETGGNIRDFYPLVQRILEFLTDLRQKLRVKLLQLHITLGGDDPCDLALNYGKTQAALGNLDPHLERFFVIKKKEISIDCDFFSEKSSIYGRIDLSITVARIFSLGFRHGIRILREFLRIMKLRKGGATK